MMDLTTPLVLVSLLLSPSHGHAVKARVTQAPGSIQAVRAHADLTTTGASLMRDIKITEKLPERLRELPVDNLSQAIAMKAGIVAQGGDLHFYREPGSEVRFQFDHELELDDPLFGEVSPAVDSAAVVAPVTLAFAPFANPLRGLLAIQCSIPAGPPAELDLIDVAGRRLARRELASRRGLQQVGLEGTRVPPGVYWMRLRQGARSATAKIVVMP